MVVSHVIVTAKPEWVACNQTGNEGQHLLRPLHQTSNYPIRGAGGLRSKKVIPPRHGNDDLLLPDYPEHTCPIRPRLSGRRTKMAGPEVMTGPDLRP